MQKKEEGDVSEGLSLRVSMPYTEDNDQSLERNTFAFQLHYSGDITENILGRQDWRQVLEGQAGAISDKE